MTHPALINDPAAAAQFILAGNATFTLKSLKSGLHYTYQVRAPWDGAKADLDNPRRFVQLRTGGDEWTYIGFFYADRLNAGKKGNRNHPAFKALDWAMTALAQRPHVVEGQLEVWHDGRCARCGRQLTDPASIERGFGPDCAAQLGIT